MGAAIMRRSNAMTRLMTDPSDTEATLQKAPARFKDPSSMFSGKGKAS